MRHFVPLVTVFNACLLGYLMGSRLPDPGSMDPRFLCALSVGCLGYYTWTSWPPYTAIFYLSLAVGVFIYSLIHYGNRRRKSDAESGGANEVSHRADGN
jgi:hypothetical protein